LFEVKTMLADLYPPVSDQQPEEGQSHGVLEEGDLPARKTFMFRKSNFHLHGTTGAGDTLGPSKPNLAAQVGCAAHYHALPSDLSLYQIRKIAHGVLQLKVITLEGRGSLFPVP
jgi:hypothetical protein